MSNHSENASPVPAAEHDAVYVASRASLPERPQMWLRLRAGGWNNTSSWIDEAGEGQTACFTGLWKRIEDEIRRSRGVILYAEEQDMPLKGALIECGLALGMGKPVAVVLPGVRLEPRSMRPVGSWLAHPLVSIHETLEAAHAAVINTVAIAGK